MIIPVVTVVAVIPIVMIVPVAMEITVATMIPMMIMFDPSVASIPITDKIPLTIMVGRNPMRLLVRRPSPISWVPPIVTSDRIPIAVYKNELRPRPGGHDGDHTRWRRSADLDSN
jgi:hypothetical protein